LVFDEQGTRLKTSSPCCHIVSNSGDLLFHMSVPRFWFFPPDFHVFGFEYFDILDCLTFSSLSAMLEDGALNSCS
jgi:hypothetical protein